MTQELNHQLFKMAAPGCGAIAFRDTDAPNTLEVILSERAAKVGPGYGITGGGFVECGDIYKEEAGFISLSADEAHRELREENPGFENIISLEDFRKRAQLVCSFNVKANDVNGVHACTYFALRLTNTEWDQVMALPPSDERVGMLKSAKLRWNDSGTINLDGADKFFHKHELKAFEAMAAHAQQGRLF